MFAARRMSGAGLLRKVTSLYGTSNLVRDEAHREERSTPAQRFVAGYGRAVYEAAAAYLEENRYLVESEALLAQVDNDRAGAAD